MIIGDVNDSRLYVSIDLGALSALSSRGCRALRRSSAFVVMRLFDSANSLSMCCGRVGF